MTDDNDGGANRSHHKYGPDRDGRDAAGRFRRGHGGRRPGSRNRVTALVERLISGEAEEIVRAMVAKAKAGNVTAGAAIMRVLIGPAKERGVPLKFKLPKLATAADSLAAIQAIAEGVASGKIDADGAKILTGIVAEFRATLSVVDQDRRMAAIESALKIRGEQQP